MTFIYFQHQKIQVEEVLNAAKKNENILNLDEDIFSFLKEWQDENEKIKLQSSGTTGKPKIFFKKKNQLRSSAKATIQYFNLKENDTFLICLSAKYIAGKMMWVRALEAKANIILMSNNRNTLEDYDDFYPNCDFAAMIPLQVYHSLENENCREKLNKIKKIIIGGGDINRKYIPQLLQEKTQFFHTYGMTETLSHIAIKNIDGNFQNNYFQVLKGVKIGKDERFCLTVYAPKIHNEKLFTNDLVNIIDEKQFEWMGRYDNIINSGGLKLLPEQIEKQLEKIIEENFFIGAESDEILENKVVLFIESDEGSETISNKYLTLIQSHLSKFEVPKKIITLPSFIYTETGKIKKNETQQSAT